MPGYPIRTSSDHSSVDNSPRPIAVSHVLHRLLMPRHPPCALTHFTTTRCSHPLCNTQQTTTPHHTNTTTHTTADVRCSVMSTARKNTHQRMSPQDPTACQARPRKTNWSVKFHPATPNINPQTRTNIVYEDEPSVKGDELPTTSGKLLRKEVIQPHLPVRLPCYDFVLIASPTFDNSLPHGLGRRLRVLPTFMT